MKRLLAYSMVLSVVIFVSCNSRSSTSTTTTTASTTPSISRVSISPSSVNLVAGGIAVQLSATLILSDGTTVENPTFTWASGNSSVVTVDANGLATGVVVEITSITATTVTNTGTISGSTRIGVVSGTPGAASLTLSGTATYEDRPYDEDGFTGVISPKPIRGAIVEVVAIDGFKVIGSGSTDLVGDFSVTVDNSANRGGVYLRVVSRTDTTTNTKIEVRNNDTSRSFFSSTSAVMDDSASDPFSGTKDILATVSLKIGGAFNILDVLTDASALVQTAGPCPDPNTGCVPSLITVYWEPGSSEGTFFDGSVDAITFLGGGTADQDSDEYDDVVIAHEYGHFILDQFSRDNSPGGAHSIIDNGQDIRLSWSEGWANFFAFAVLNSPIYVDTVEGGIGTVFNIENYTSEFTATLSSVAIYTTNELAVAGTLWDVFDAVDMIESDPLDLDFTKIFQTLLSFPIDKPTTMETFWTQFASESATSASSSDLQTILTGRQIELFADAGESAETALIVDVTAQKHTLYLDASDPVGDIDIINFPADSGMTYTVSTLNLSNGADTFLTIRAPNGDTTTNDNPSDGNFLTCSSTCPKNNTTNLAAIVTFTAAETGTYTAKVTHAPNAPSSAGKLGSYEIQLTSP